ncbi:hypothetical protein U9M48_028779 [Paspalum notatum var. saurae]|uniref:Uncharacterized protein n=1 Tax=Paspalum notatum var. saurae TaxID=547442 RepID=A0AAQ3TZB7_PASNO
MLFLPKYQRGIEITDLEVQNKCLLSKWLHKLQNKDGELHQLLRKKYNKTIVEPGNSHFCPSLMKVHDCSLNLSTFKGTQCRFLDDRCLGKALVVENLTKWNELVAKIAFVQFDNQHDSIKWALSRQGTFLRTIYVSLLCEPNSYTSKQIFVKVETTFEN